MKKIAILSWLFLANFALAQHSGTTPPKYPSIRDPLGVKTVQELVTKILNLVFQVGLPAVILMFVWSGFLFVTAQGNEGQITKAKKSFTYTVIGAAIVLGAGVISVAIEGTIKNLGVK